MRYREVPPPPSLRPWVRCFWVLEGECAPGDVERVLPDGCPELVVHYGAPMRRRLPDDLEQRQPRAVAAGQLDTALRLIATGSMGMVGARLHPWSGGAVLGEAQQHLADRVVPLDALWNGAARALVQRVGDADRDATRLRALADTLLARGLHLPPAHDELAAACGAIAASGGRLPVARLAQHLGWSRRRLERHFQQEVGLAPKSLCRVTRFRRVVERLGAPPPGGLAELAQDTGYADQPHLARDFRELAGLTVTDYLAEQHALSDAFTAGATR